MTYSKPSRRGIQSESKPSLDDLRCIGMIDKYRLGFQEELVRYSVISKVERAVTEKPYILEYGANGSDDVVVKVLALMIFGSSAYGAALTFSDVDMALDLGAVKLNDEDRDELLKQVMRRIESLVQNVTFVKGKGCSVIRGEFVEQNGSKVFKFDIVVKSRDDSRICRELLLRGLQCGRNRYTGLAALVKIWACKMDIGSTRTGGLCSFGWTILVTRFLQEKKYLEVKSAKELEKMKGTRWNFKANKHTRMDRIAQVFMQFLEFTAKLDSFIGELRELTIDGSYKSIDQDSKAFPIYHEGQHIGIFHRQCHKDRILKAAAATAAALRNIKTTYRHDEADAFVNELMNMNGANVNYRGWTYQYYDELDMTCGIKQAIYR